MRAKPWLHIFLLLCLTAAALVASAQDAVPTLPPASDGAACAGALQTLWTAASDACIGGPEGFICNGGATPYAEPAGPISNALAPVGALVEAALVDVVQTPPNSPEMGMIGAAWLRMAQPLRVTALMLGSVAIRDASPPDFPAWQSMIVQSSPDPSTCLAAPANVVILQSELDVPARIAVNGVSLALNGTVLISAVGDATNFVALSGVSSLITFGQEQPLFTGQQISVPHAGGDYSRPAGLPGAGLPFDSALTRFLPVPLLDRPFVLPQPGTVTTQGMTNLRTFPSTDAGIVAEVPAGQVATVLGRNPAGDWYNVRIPGGLTGWMRVDLLQVSVGNIEAIFDATPSIPQRLGELGRAGRIVAPNGVNLRTGPDPGFPALAALNNGAVVTLLARSPYSPWVKVDAGGAIGWVALLTIDTRAYLDALPFDFDVPPQPTPTLVPGSFGNAFPDPNANGGN
jgi:uncharacterized protein YraI